ncbi:serine hydrolase [Sphingomonas sp. PL-96]|nr:serine hydrolase [Sphingomonas sp. PL-96]
MGEPAGARSAGPDVALSARSAICIQLSRGLPGSFVILHEKDADRPAPPASITKLLTAVTALHILDRGNMPAPPELVVEAGDLAEGSGRNLRAGDCLSFQDMLANVLLASSNIGANVLARHFGRMLLQQERAAGIAPIDRFVREMNAVAQSLRMKRSHFLNPHGLGARGQHSTARDLSQLVVACLDYPAITGVWGKPRHVLSIGGPDPRQLPVASIFQASTRKLCPDFAIPQFRGGKSGSLYPSLFNLAAVSERANGERVASVTIGSPTVMDRYGDYLALTGMANAASTLAAPVSWTELARALSA